MQNVKLTQFMRENPDLSDFHNKNLSPQLIGLEGRRVEVTDKYGETRRFWVSKSTGCQACHLEIKTRRSFAGDCADKEYVKIRIIEKAGFFR